MGRTIQISGMPLSTTKQALVDFLEEEVGKGSVYACNLKKPKVQTAKSRMFANVQFENDELAMNVYDLARSGRLVFRSATLKAQPMSRDIVSRPKSMPLCLKAVTLYMGCLTSQNSFSILWSSSEVDAAFEFESRRISVEVTVRFIKYKLELSFRDVRYIHKRTVRGKGIKLLLLQLQNGPRISHKDESGSISLFDDDELIYYRDSRDNQWIRTTDFTRSCSIGQSSSLCLELPYGVSIAQIHENFTPYKEIGESLWMRMGSSFSSTSKLVPIMNPPPGLDIPYTIMFKVNSLVQLGNLSGPTLDRDFFSLLQPNGRSSAHVKFALDKLGTLKNTIYDPVKWLQKQYNEFKRWERQLDSGNIMLDNGLMYVHRVMVTPSRIYFLGPEPNVSNRVTRHYAEHINNFLRVSFVDEDLNGLRSSDLCLRMGEGTPGNYTKIYKRILSILSEGIAIGDKRFEFLAFSSSQLRESSVWMFAPTATVSADSIRKWMGDLFRIRNIAKCAARMGQSFSSSTETLRVPQHEIELMDDIEVHSNGTRYTFSDGIGKISASLAKQVAAKCRCDKVPSAFQIRYGGYKGVVAVDPKSSCKLSLRPSMRKYMSNNTNLDVLSWTRYRPCYLNRQIITLLSTLGVQDHNFELLQQKAIENLDQILISRERALEILPIMSAGDNHKALTDMLMCGYLPDSEPYLSMMLQAFRASKLLELRFRTRIFVREGQCLMGCLDETRRLEYGQVFIQVTHLPGKGQFHNVGRSAGKNDVRDPCVLEGKVIVAKNPCLHPGDVRILTALNIPELKHMVDCVVFPQRGRRPHPNECSGSDLDGDLYFVCWDKSLILPRQDAPMNYIPQPAVELDHEVSIKEIQEYFANYMINDTLGIIANSHTVFADQEPEKARSSACLRLAELFSTAVDFPKTGIAAQFPRNLYPKEYPDFMEKEDKPMYESTGIIGKLYRSVIKVAPSVPCIGSFTKDVARRAYDKDLEVEGFENYLSDALMHKNWYDSKLNTLMDHYGVSHEAEIVSGNISSLSRYHRKKQGDIREVIMLALKSLRKEAREWFEAGSDSGSSDDQFAKASAWYHVTYHPDYFGDENPEESDENNYHFISFPWVICDKLLQIKRQRQSHGFRK